MLSDLPLEIFESVMIRAFLVLYLSDAEPDDDQSPAILGKSRNTERRAFTWLSTVCRYWYQTLIGWPESPTRLWLRHKLKKLIQSKYTHS